MSFRELNDLQAFLLPHCRLSRMLWFILKRYDISDVIPARHLDSYASDFIIRRQFQGAMGLMIGGKEAVLQEKQSIRFRADVPHAYENLSQECCCAYNMIVYPNP